MGLINTFQKWFGRNSTPGPGDDFWYNPIGASTFSPIRITPDSAMQSTAVIGCVKVISETIAGLPLPLYRKQGDGKKRETNHVIAKLLSTTPCPWMTSFEWREMMTAFVLLRGNAYAQKVKSRRGELISLNPLNPTWMKVSLNTESSELEYRYKVRGLNEILLEQDEVFHLKGYSTDGITGISVISMAANAIGLAIAAEQYGAKVFTNDARPGGILKHPGKLSDDAHKRIQKSWQDAHAGIENAHKVGIVEEGMDWIKVGMSSEDVQFIDSRKFQVEEIARMFRVPPHMIQDLSRATFSNIEHQSLSFVQHTLLPWLRRWEGAINVRLIPSKEQETLFAEYLVDGLLRGDTQARYSAYQVGRQNGWLSANDIRKLENMEPLDGEQGDMYVVQANMVDAEKLASGEVLTGTVGQDAPNKEAATTKDDNSSALSGDKATKTQQNSLNIEGFRTLFQRITDRLGTKELKKRISMLKNGESRTEIDKFYDSHSLMMIDELRAVFDCFVPKPEENQTILQQEVSEYIDKRKSCLEDAVVCETKMRKDLGALVNNLIHTYEKEPA